jgi:predicted lipid carrier protein YhbT
MKPPLPLSLLLRSLPNGAHGELLSRLFNHLLKGQYLSDQLAELEGKTLAIAITDTGNQLTFLIRNGKFARAAGNHWDVRIKGRLEEFWLLATRAEDPDTLFFHRRLAIEGETETGLHLKNLLDSMEFDWRAHVDAVAGARLAPVIKRVVEKLRLEKRVQFVLHH